MDISIKCVKAFSFSRAEILMKAGLLEDVFVRELVRISILIAERYVNWLSLDRMWNTNKFKHKSKALHIHELRGLSLALFGGVAEIKANGLPSDAGCRNDPCLNIHKVQLQVMYSIYFLSPTVSHTDLLQKRPSSLSGPVMCFFFFF